MSENSKTVAEATQKSSKLVTVFSTRDNAMTEIPNSTATTWKELQKEFKEFGINYSGMKVIVGETRNTLEADIAVVPDLASYTVYLYPIKVKAGSERTDLFDKIKAWVGKDEARKQKFIVNGNNMTRLSTDVLKELANKYIGGSTIAPEPAPVKKAEAKQSIKDRAAEKTVADIVGSVADFKALEENVDKAKAAYKKAVLNDMDEETQEKLLEKLSSAQAALKEAKGKKEAAPVKPVKDEAPKETPEQIAAREALEEENKRKAEKKQALAKEASNLKSYLSGIQ